MAAPAFAALSRMLESARQSRRMDVQESLAMMQMAQKAQSDSLAREMAVSQQALAVRRQDYYDLMGTLSAEKQRKEIELADYTEMENRLIGLENHNKEDGLLLMNKWIDSMGLRFSEAPEWGEEVYDLLSGKKGVGFSGKNADRLINAIKDLKTAQNYLPALYLMNDINNAMVGQLGDITKLSPDQWNLLEGFRNMGAFQQEVDPATGKKTKRIVPSREWDIAFKGGDIILQNQFNIDKELKELRQTKDLVIQSDIKMIEREERETALSAAEFLGEEKRMNELREAILTAQEEERKRKEALDTGLTPKQFEAKELNDSINNVRSIIDAKQDTLDTRRNQLSNISMYEEGGYGIPSDEIDNIAGEVERLAKDIEAQTTVMDSLKRVKNVEMPIDLMLEQRGLPDTPENRKIAEKELGRLIEDIKLPSMQTL